MMSLNEILLRVNEFRQMSLAMYNDFGQVLQRVGLMQILEKDPQRIIEAAKDGKIPFSGDNGALNILRLKKRLLEIQNLFYDFSEFLEPMDLIAYLEQEEYKYVMSKARQNNDDISSACKIGNIMFTTTIRNIVVDNKRWGLMVYRIKEKWRRQNIRRVV